MVWFIDLRVCPLLNGVVFAFALVGFWFVGVNLFVVVAYFWVSLIWWFFACLGLGCWLLLCKVAISVL